MVNDNIMRMITIPMILAMTLTVTDMINYAVYYYYISLVDGHR